VLERALRAALSSGLAASDVLIASGFISRRDYGWLLAGHLNAKTAYAWQMIDKAIDLPLARPSHAPLEAISDEPLVARGILHVPAAEPWVSRLIRLAARRSGDARAIRICEPSELRVARHSMEKKRHLEDACHSLANTMPAMSAMFGISRTGWLAASAIASVAVAALFFPASAAGTICGMFLCALYFVSVLFRAFLAIVAAASTDKPAATGRQFPNSQLPRYSVLVALHKEAGQVGDLVLALSQLDWPKDKLEVFLVCEADDHETLAALDATSLKENFRVVCCPPSLPRTKPKALNYAMPLATGEFLVIYDAEDRPHPGQLKEAHARFFAGDHRLACLQAPLLIHNARQNLLTALFALEYRTLFRGILPALETLGGPLPLGGTSNHFRLETLRRVAGWDAWNVTEDADLGVRLYRLGYRCGILTLPTLEEAPPIFSVWLRQRTRWMKGWMQTTFVHLRSPAGLWRDLGPRGFFVFHMMLTVITLSVLIHPVFMAALAWQIAGVVENGLPSGSQAVIIGLSVFNWTAGYVCYFAMALLVMPTRQLARTLGLLLLLPVYWLLISLAGWRAAWQLVNNPFLWEKTQHGLAKSSMHANIHSEGNGKIGQFAETGR
jgi:cellulose synthase/poly-beta-1,6-N-acetylglucosamine synthase-like glycosyltransferase